MDKDSRDKRFIRKPIFKGGNKDFSKFLYSNLKYPKVALEKKIQGTVIVRYDIDNKGDVIKAKVLSSLGYGCDEEAIRVIKLLKFDIPKGPRKLKITFHRTTKVKFVLPKEAPKKVQPITGNAVSYQYVKKEKAVAKKGGEKKEKTFSYNISW